MTGAAALPVRHAEECMGTVFSFDVRSPGIDWTSFARILQWLHETDARFSTYRADSEVNRIADGRLTVAQAHRDVREVLAACEEVRTATGGYFSAFPDGRLDPSGYVKGWAIRRAGELLAAAGSVNHCVNGGGDVSCSGAPPRGRGWRVGIADASSPGRLLRTVEAPGPLAVATSGAAERGAHIIDPHTGRRPTDLLAVTVISPDIVQADVFATAAVAMGAAGEDWLRSVDVDAVVVRGDGGVTAIRRAGRAASPAGAPAASR
jgi:thiamine biosynthesis lipoprotein